LDQNEGKKLVFGWVEKPKIWNIYQFQIIQIASYTPYRICNHKNEMRYSYGFR